jgi:hypothetical protein
MEKIQSPTHHAPRLPNAVFIDLDGSRSWRAFFSNHKVDAIVIQNILGYPAQGDPFDKSAEAIEVLNEAPSDVKNIYVGLVFEETFNSADVPEQKLVDAAAEDGRVATTFWNRLTQQQRTRVSGWYLAREIHNFKADEKRRQAVQSYLRAASEAVPQRPTILISPYFVPPVKNRPDLLPSAPTGELFSYLIKGSKVNGVLLQDGVGARNDPAKKLGCRWSLDSYVPVAAQFAREVRKQLPEDVQFWANVEAFGDDASPARLKKQLAVTPEAAPVIVFAYRECAMTEACRKR